MIGPENLLPLGSALAKLGLKFWLKDDILARETALTVTEMLERKLQGPLERNRAKREFERIAEDIAEHLAPYFGAEFGGLAENELRAAALTLAATIEQVRIDKELLFKLDLDPAALEHHIRERVPRAAEEALLDPAASRLYDFALRESCNYIVEMTMSLPPFQGQATREILQRETELAGLVRRALEQLPRAQEPRDDPSERFEREYVRQVARKLDALELFGIDLHEIPRRFTLSVAYITLSASTATDTSEGKGAREGQAANGGDDDVSLLRVDRALGQSRNTLIRGEAGSGKTTLLQWLAVTAARSSFQGALEDWNAAVPFFIQLRRYGDQRLPAPEDFPRDVAPALVGDMPQGWVHERLRDGRALVLVDGVDELPSERREDAREWLADLQRSYPEARYVVTSRPPAVGERWMEDLDLIGTDLQPMTLADVRSFIQHWHAAAAEGISDQEDQDELAAQQAEIQRLVKEQPALRSIATTPLLCAMLCALHRSRRTQLPRDRVQLYRIALEMLLERRDVERQVELVSNVSVSLRERELLLQALSYSLILNQATDVGVDEAISVIEAQLESMPHVNSDGREVFEYLLVRSGLLREPVPGRVDFIHRTFQEYLAAREALENNHVDFLVSQAHEDQWRETIVLAAGLAQAVQRERLISGILERGDAEGADRHRLHLLAAACLETSPHLSRDLAEELRARMERLVPPRNLTEARALASAGDLAAPMLAQRPQWRATEAAAAVRALGLIGTDTAYSAIRSYASDRRVTVARELLRAWASFDPISYGRDVLHESPLDNGEVEIEDTWQLPALQYLRRLKGVRCTFYGRDLEVAGLEVVEVPVSLWSRGSGVTSIDALRAVRQLVSLAVMDAEHLVDVSAVAAHPGLRFLSFAGDKELSDIGAVAELRNLTRLIIDSTAVSDLTPLEGLEKLERLECSWCPNVRDLEPLRPLERLTSLDLRGCGSIDNVEPLTDLATLETLWLSDCHNVASLAPLTPGRSIRNIHLSGCRGLTDLSGLEEAALASLSAGGAGLTTLSGLGSVSDLTSVRTPRALSLQDVSQLNGAFRLRFIDFSGCRSLTDFTFLHSARGAISIDLSGCIELPDVTFASGMKNLVSLRLAGCRRIEDLSPLRECRSLMWLDLDGCRAIRDLSPLEDLPNLESVSLFGCDPRLDVRRLRSMGRRVVFGPAAEALPF